MIIKIFAAVILAIIIEMAGNNNSDSREFVAITILVLAIILAKTPLS